MGRPSWWGPAPRWSWTGPGRRGAGGGEVLGEATGAGRAGAVELDPEGHARHGHRDGGYRQGPQHRRPAGPGRLSARPRPLAFARRCGSRGQRARPGRAPTAAWPCPVPRGAGAAGRRAGDVVEVKDLGLDDGHGPGGGASSARTGGIPGNVASSRSPRPGGGPGGGGGLPRLSRGRAAGREHAARSPRRPAPPPTARGGKAAGTPMSAPGRAG